MSYDNLSSVSQNVLKFYQQLTGEERRILFIFDDFRFCRSRVIGLDITENRIFTLCHMITWVVFLRMFWNFISSLPVKRGGSLSFLPFQSYWTWYDGKMDFYPMSYDNLSSVSQNVLKFYQQLTGEERRVPFIFGRNNQECFGYGNRLDRCGVLTVIKAHIGGRFGRRNRLVAAHFALY